MKGISAQLHFFWKGPKTDSYRSLEPQVASQSAIPYIASRCHGFMTYNFYLKKQ